MKSITRAMLIACLVLPVIACGKKEEPQQVEAAPVAVPTTEDKTAWNAYLNDVAGRHMEGVNNSPYVYLVPPAPRLLPMRRPQRPRPPTVTRRCRRRSTVRMSVCSRRPSRTSNAASPAATC